MARVMKVQKSEAIAHFQYEGRLIKDEPFGNGHINDTFLLTFELNKMGRMKAILQRMNNSIFEEPVQLMENILGVTDFLREKIAAAGGDPTRETLSVIPAVDGKPYYKDSFGDYWRSYIFITDATSFDQVERPEQFYQSGVAFGNFQRMLADYPADTLFEVIKGFHDTKARLEVFKKAVEADVMGRAKDVQEEIRFVLDREDVANYLCDCLANGEIPLRVTHNDTKLNNVMILAILSDLVQVQQQKMRKIWTKYPAVWNTLKPIQKDSLKGVTVNSLPVRWNFCQWEQRR